MSIMKSVFRFSIFVLLGTSLYSCENTTINDQPRAELSFNELPDTIQKLYLCFQGEKDTTIINQEGNIISLYPWHHRDTLICLDKDIHTVDHKVKKSWLPWIIDGTYWVFDGKKLYYASTKGWEHTPYILYKRQLYFVASVNVIDIKAEIMSSDYGRYDLSNVLK